MIAFMGVLADEYPPDTATPASEKAYLDVPAESLAHNDFGSAR